jgi:4'-phosphopantetheinyl transferase EntD
MLTELVPRQVAVAEKFADVPGVALFPQEAAAVAHAVDQRRREFATVRACAREALARLDLPPAPIVPGRRGAPRWPDGVVGSMTHCAGYRAAAVSRAIEVVTLGIDAEPHEPLPEGVLDLISRPEERAMLSVLGSGSPQACWDRLLFSAKESVYKAWFPLAGRWLSFEEAVISISPDDGTFTARLLVPAPVVNGSPLTGFAGGWLVRDGLILTAIALSRHPGSRA